MRNSDNLTRKEYYDLVCEELVRLGHDNRPDYHTVEMDYEQDKSHVRSAAEFAAEWTDDEL